jgi:tetratricopeptide (TPR) repeat protein
MDRSDSETHQRVLALVAHGQTDQDTLAERLSPAERAARGEQYVWSPKDHVAHNNFWREDGLLHLQAALQGGTPPVREDDQIENDRVFWKQRDTSWEELAAETERLRAETVRLIQQLGPDDLSQRDRYPWQHGASLEGVILVDWYDHPSEHWVDVYLGRGELDRAIELRLAVGATIRELFPDDPKRYSYMAYKLGVLYARNGRPEQAIDAIREALTVNPSLVERARTDSDLDPIRALPAFQAIVGA